MHTPDTILLAYDEDVNLTLLVVDQKETVVQTNLIASLFFGRDGQDGRGGRCGDLFGCVNRNQDPQGCGYSRICNSCGLNTAIKDVLKSSPSITDIDLTIDIERPGGRERRWFLATVVAFMVDGSRHAIAALMDITERKNVEKALRESEERFRAVFENTFIGIYRTTPDGQILLANPALITMLGYRTFKELSKRNLEKDGYYPGYDRGTFKKLMELANEIVGHEAPWRRRDGSIIWVRESARAVHDMTGQIIFYEGTVEDVTSRKMAELALQDSERKYRSMVESINDVVFSMDSAGVITYISPVVERIVHFRVSEIVGRSFARFVQADDIEELNKSFSHSLAETVESSAYRIVDKDGSVKHVRITSHQIVDNGTVVGVTGTLTDCTQQYRAELEKTQMEDELRQAQKMEAIGQLAGGVAHDFNNMLAGIMGNAEMLLVKLSNEPALAELAERIVKTSENAAKLTRQLLSFARKGQYEQTPVDVHKMIVEVVGMLSNTIDRRIKIRQQLLANPATVLGDTGQLESALLNLGLNARDAMQHGGELVFSTQIEEIDDGYIKLHGYKMQPGKYVQVTVTDTGIGMPPEVRAHVFEPFFTTKEQGKGTGLGLASVYGIVKGHNGAIEVYSERGHGTAIKIFLPLLQDEPEANSPILSRPVAFKPGHGSILLADDEKMIREIASQMLQSIGYSVKICADGREAVDYYRANHGTIDLVILDMIMPQLNGRETFLELRKINPGVQVLLSSGFSADGEAQEVMKLGIRGFVQKPYRLKEMADKISEVLGNT